VVFILNELEFAITPDVSNHLRRSPIFVSHNLLQAFGVIGPICRIVGLANSSAYGGLAKGSPKANSSYGETLPPKDARQRTLAIGRIRPRGESSSGRRKFVRKAKVRPKGESQSYGGYSASG
jgi:hypothetical protein